VAYLLTVAGAALALSSLCLESIAPTSRLILLSYFPGLMAFVSLAAFTASRTVVADSKTPEAAVMVGD